MIEVRAYREADQDDVVTLWRGCELVKRWNDPTKDIRRKLDVQRDLFLVGLLDGKLVATVIAGYEGHRGWINYLAVSKGCREMGFGHLMMDEAEERLRAMGYPKVNLQVRSSNTDVIRFYESLGYTEDDVVSMGKRLEQD